MIIVGMVITCYVTGVELKPEQKREMIRYMLGKQRSDGGWGMYGLKLMRLIETYFSFSHIEAKSDMFGSCLQYVSLRLLGVPADHPAMEKGRKFIKDNGINISQDPPFNNYQVVLFQFLHGESFGCLC